MMTAIWKATIPVDRHRDVTAGEVACIRSSWSHHSSIESRSTGGLLVRQRPTPFDVASTPRCPPTGCPLIVTRKSPEWGGVSFGSNGSTVGEGERYEDRSAHRHRAWFAAGSRPRRRRSLARLVALTTGWCGLRPPLKGGLSLTTDQIRPLRLRCQAGGGP